MVADRPLVVVDAANVVGSVPDGWWRDRFAATERLRDALAPMAQSGIGDCPGPVDLLLVVEGAAREVPGIPGVRVVAAPGDGDDTVVEVVRRADRRCLVVTADRRLRDRVVRLGAEVVGPSAVRG
ncbi:MAG TPA: hypothetical protein VFZ32_22165 [Micromonosporaceae bacterium]